MKGLNPDSGTRSSLLWENIRLLKKAKENNTLPKYIMVENVKNLVSNKFIEHFNNLINIFNDLSFNTYWSVINGKDCGVPQNHERVFVIAIRKNIDVGKYTFPQPFDTEIRLKDILEDIVDEKYYLSNKMKQKMILNLDKLGKNFIDIIGHSGSGVQKGYIHSVNGGVGASSATDYKQPKQISIDKSINNTRVIEYANCITSRENRGVSNRKSEGTAILEQVDQIYETEKELNPQTMKGFSRTLGQGK